MTGATLPARTGDQPSTYKVVQKILTITELQKNLRDIHEQADLHAQQQQQRYATYYNKRARPKQFQCGQQVILLLPDSTSKLLSKWQGPALVVDYKKPHSYLIELEGGKGVNTLVAC